MKDSCQFLIIGAGITGLTIAHELLLKRGEDIVILEKENGLGFHASGRNSGVLHAGIYYTPETLKAKYCVSGNSLMKGFCKEKGLTLKETGKVIVAKTEDELPTLYELKQRADLSGAKAIIIDSKELKETEPYAATYEKALFSPNTAVIKPDEVLKALLNELENSGKVKIFFNTHFLKTKNTKTAITSKGTIKFEKFINAGGAFSDKIAHKFGLGLEYKLLPFKGTYKKLKRDKTFLVRGNIYPVPDLRNPFLGIHFTKSADSSVCIGPSAIPALGRENYGVFDGLNKEVFSILYREALLFIKNRAFRDTAFGEIKKYWKKFVFEEAKRLIPQLQITDIEDSLKVGIRPQLINYKEKKLVMDFVVIQEENSIHILNAISPAFTSSMAFARFVVGKIL